MSRRIFSAPVRVYISDMLVFCWSQMKMMHVFGISFAICFPSGPILATFGSFWVGILVFVLLHLLSVVIGFIALPPHPFLLVISLPLVLIQIY